MTTKRRLGITEAFVSETILFTCGNSACERGAFAPSLAVRRSIVAVESRASEVHFTLDICDVPRTRPSSYSVVLLSDDPSAPEHEVVLQVEEGVMSAVVHGGDEIRCGLQMQVSSLSGRQPSIRTRKRTRKLAHPERGSLSFTN